MPRSSLPDAFRIHYEIQYVGRTVKHAKRRVTFKFAFEGDSDEHSVVLLHTINSGKKVVFLNGNQIFEEENVRAGGGSRSCKGALPHRPAALAARRDARARATG